MPEKISRVEAQQKIERYCAYQERSHQEVKAKLFSYGLRTDEVDEILSELVTSNFLNEERFAKAFSGGKFRMKKWGRNKIVHALEAKGLTANCIRSGLNEIDSSDYNSTLRELILKKIELTDAENVFQKRDKISKSLIARGYEPELVWSMLRELLPDHK